MGVQPETVYLPQTVGGQPHMTGPHNIPFYSQNVENILASQPLQPQASPIGQPQQQIQQQVDQVPAQDLQAQAPQPQQEQPRFPNIVHEEPPENRDWLDMFYSMSRLMIFLTLVYFYSSPTRCLVVLFVGVALYL